MNEHMAIVVLGRVIGYKLFVYSGGTGIEVWDDPGPDGSRIRAKLGNLNFDPNDTAWHLGLRLLVMRQESLIHQTEAAQGRTVAEGAFIN